MSSLLDGLLRLFVAHPYLLVAVIVAGVLVMRTHGRIRRVLRLRGWSRRGRRVLAYTVSAFGLAMILLGVGYLIPVLAFLL